MAQNKQTSNPRYIASNFLEKSSFYNYQNYHLYLPKLSTEIKAALRQENPFNLTLPTGNPIRQDTKIIYSMELGGTYLKIYQSQIKNGKVKTLRREKLSFFKNINYTPNILFAHLKRGLDKFINIKDRSELTELFFIFAFPLQPSIRKNKHIDGKIKYFGKTRKSQGIIGLNLGQKLENYLQKQGYPKLNISVINDGIANLLATRNSLLKFPPNPTAATISSPELIINLIAGTGTNICVSYNSKKHLHFNNLEFGDFHCFPAASFDLKLKSQLPAPTQNRFLTEKLFAGTWQNQLINIITKQLIKEKSLKALPHPNFLNWSSDQLERFFSGPLPLQVNRQLPFRTLQIIWQELNKRGAFICAIAITQIIQYLTSQGQFATPPDIKILLSGGILDNSPVFRQNLKKNLKKDSLKLLQIKDTTDLATAMLKQIQNL